LWLQAGVFGAARMRVTRAGVGIARRGVHVGLCATLRPPASSIFFGLAHLCATTVHSRFLAMAVTASRRDTPQQGGRIGEQRQSAGEQTNAEARHSAQKPLVAECSNARTWHAPSCVSLQRKTDSAVCLGVPLPGLWNWNRLKQDSQG
jgi:hypothetical protein